MRLTRKQPGDPILASDYNKLVDVCNLLTNMRTGNGLEMQATPAGICLNAKRLVPQEVTGSALALSSGWLHLSDYQSYTRIYFGAVPDPDPMYREYYPDYPYNPSQSFAPSKPVGYNVASSTSRIRVVGQMLEGGGVGLPYFNALPDPTSPAPSIRELGLFYVNTSLSVAIGAYWFNLTTQYLDIMRPGYDVNYDSVSLASWPYRGWAEYVQLKIFVD